MVVVLLLLLFVLFVVVAWVWFGFVFKPKYTIDSSKHSEHATAKPNKYIFILH